MITGAIILKGVIDMARNIMSPVYFYVYDYANKNSLNTFYGPCTKQLGVTHGDEMTSLFDTVGMRLNEHDRNVSRLLVDIWTNFASSMYGIELIDIIGYWRFFSVNPLFFHTIFDLFLCCITDRCYVLDEKKSK